MILLRNTPKELLHLGFTGYVFSSHNEVFSWIKSISNEHDYYLLDDNVVFLRNPPAETMLWLKYNDKILLAYYMQKNRTMKFIKA